VGALPAAGLTRLVHLALLLVTACARPGGAPDDVRRVSIVDISDWHGQLEPLTVMVDGRARPVAGAAALKAYFDRERAQNPGGTLIMTAGDAYSATPPLSRYFDDVPAVEAQNLMGIDVDTLGNHNFDHGLDYLRRLLAVARFPYVAANIVDPDGQPIVAPTRIFTRNGVRVGVIGIGSPETPALVGPGRFGAYRFLDPVPVINAHARALRLAGAHVVVVLAHIGATAVGPDGVPHGPLAEVARAIEGVDVLIGDHTDVSVNALVGGVLVVENRSRGLEYALIQLDYDLTARRVVRKHATLKRPWADEVTPDPGLLALIERYRTAIRPLFDRRTGQVARVLTRSRQQESLLGNLETDVLRAAYGARVAFDVSGALRDDLPSSYRPGDGQLRRPGPGFGAGPPWDVVEGDFYAVFPFHNVAVTFRLSGATLWQALENSVSQGALVGGRFANGAGRFLQVSGFRYRFDPRQPPGQRVTAVSLDDGSPVPRDGTSYPAVTSDFVFSGGDGYRMLVGAAGVTRELIAETMSQAVRQRPSADARIEGRITVEGAASGRLLTPAILPGAPSRGGS
jgi:5'-nucleotidase